MLIHKDIAKEALVAIKNKLDEKDVTLVGDSKAREIIPDMEKATDADWATEYLDYKMSVKIVDSVEEAIDHIYKYSTGHSECIVTENAGTASVRTRAKIIKIAPRLLLDKFVFFSIAMLLSYKRYI
mgnify:CR=1 FL=1